MDYKKMKKHIDAFVASVPFSVLAADGSNSQDFFCADVVGDRRFAQNFGGYPRSEIAEINDQANLEIQKSLLNQLIDYRSQEKGNSKSDIELALGHRSKYCQTATEQQSWIEEQLKVSYERNLAMAEMLQAKQRASQPNVEVPNVEPKVDEK